MGFANSRNASNSRSESTSSARSTASSAGSEARPRTVFDLERDAQPAIGDAGAVVALGADFGEETRALAAISAVHRRPVPATNSGWAVIARTIVAAGSPVGASSELAQARRDAVSGSAKVGKPQPSTASAMAAGVDLAPRAKRLQNALLHRVFEPVIAVDRPAVMPRKRQHAGMFA